MNEPSDAAQLLAAYRDAIEPDPSALEAVWADVVDPDAELRIVERRRAAPPPRRVSRLAWGGGLVALAAAAALAWWMGSTLRTPTAVGAGDPSQAEYGAAPREPSQAAKRASPRANAKEPRPLESGEAVPPEPMPSLEPSPAAAGASGATRSHPRAPKIDPLVRETALVREAEALLRKGDPAAALEVLAEHAREHADGALAVERAALRVIALCRSGNAVQGRGEVTLLERHAASKPYRERMRRACAVE